MSEYGVVLFHTTSAAFKAEKVLERAGIGVKMIPVPREFSSDCGISARFPWAQASRVEAVLGEQDVDIAEIRMLSSE